jgi:hypothetical protein
MRLQKGKKLTKNSSFLTQAPNRKQALNHGSKILTKIAFLYRYIKPMKMP